jgi:hypothetical protein
MCCELHVSSLQAERRQKKRTVHKELTSRSWMATDGETISVLYNDKRCNMLATAKYLHMNPQIRLRLWPGTWAYSELESLVCIRLYNFTASINKVVETILIQCILSVTLYHILTILEPSSVISFIVLITFIFHLTCFGLTLGHLQRLLSKINLKYYFGTYIQGFC